MVSTKTLLSLLAAAGLIHAAPGISHDASLIERQAIPKLVFSHFMVPYLLPESRNHQLSGGRRA